MRVKEREVESSGGGGFLIASARPRDAGRLFDHAWRIHTTEPEVDLPDPGEFRLTVDDLRRRVRRLERAGNGCFLVAAAEGDVIGSLQMLGGEVAKFAHTAEVGMSVRSDWRRRGVGRALLAIAIEAARASPVLRRIHLRVFSTNASALRLYESAGFLVEGRQKGHVRLGDEFVDLIRLGLDL